MWEIHFEGVLTGQLVIQGDIEEKKNCTAIFKLQNECKFQHSFAEQNHMQR